jgi:PST family polysaccharide transporter
MIALYIGPQGTGLTEQFKNFLQGAQGMSALGIQEGITKFTAQLNEEKKKINSFLHSSLKLVFIWSLMAGFLIVLFSKQINDYLFPTHDFSNFIVWTGILLPFLALNLIIMAILKGLQEYKKIISINILTNVLSALIAGLLISQYQIAGAFLVILAGQILQFIIAVYIFLRSKIDLKSILKNSFDYKQLTKLSPYIIMAVISAVVIPLFTILIRNHIFIFFGDEGASQAGYWDATKKITNLYLSLITPVFAMHYFPQMAKINKSRGLRKEIGVFLRQILPFFTLGIISIYLFRTWLIKLFFSEAYLPMESLFLWQLMGEYIKIISLLLAYFMLAKAHLKIYIISEIGFWAIYYLLTLILMNIYGLKGVVIAYFFAYLIYLLFLTGVYFNYLTHKNVVIK